MNHFDKFTKAHMQLNTMAESFATAMRQCREAMSCDSKVKDLLIELGHIAIRKREHVARNKTPFDPETGFEAAVGKCTDSECACNGYVNKLLSCQQKKKEWEGLCAEEIDVVHKLKAWALLQIECERGSQ